MFEEKNTRKVFSSQMVIHNQTLVKFGDIIINYHIWKCCKYATLSLTGCNEGLQRKKKKQSLFTQKQMISMQIEFANTT